MAISRKVKIKRAAPKFEYYLDAESREEQEDDEPTHFIYRQRVPEREQVQPSQQQAPS